MSRLRRGWLALRSHPRLVMAIGALAAVRAAWRPSTRIEVGMTVWECLTVSLLVALAVNLVAITVRAGWLAGRTTRAVRRLPREIPSAGLVAAATRCGVDSLIFLADVETTAFCAGTLRPRVYITAGAAAALSPAELDAVLSHEQAHAVRRDPLRGLLRRAAADVLFFLPVADWWARRCKQRAECGADRVAIARVGVPAVAGALLSASAGLPPTGSAAFNAEAEARIRQLSGEEALTQRLPLSRLVSSLVGLVAAVSLFMCTGQAVVALAGVG